MGSEKIYIAVFDPEEDTVNTIEVPENTEVDVSRRLGKWRLGSVWQLGENEGLEGRLLSETIVKNFKIPVTYWADDQALAFIQKGNLAEAIFGHSKTNLTFADKLRLLAFSLQVKEFKRTNINLTKTNYLKEQKLIGGEQGFIVTKVMPDNLLVIASDNLISAGNLKLTLTNATGSNSLSEKLGAIIEAMGTKVAAVQNVDQEDKDCEVQAKDLKIAERFASVFGCDIGKDLTDLNFDVDIKFGTQFADRF